MKCLIVDDDPAMRTLLKHLLSPVAHCDVAYDGHEAVAVFRVAIENHEPYGLICMDIDMPLGNGHDALQAMRALEAQHGVLGSDGAKVIMVSGMKDGKHCMQAFREGCEEYLFKPIDRKKLLATVDALLGAAAVGAGAA
jgi:two-component system chemotaxis response regulator CheY